MPMSNPQIVEAKENLVKIQQDSDAAILKKVAIENEIRVLDSRRIDEEQKLSQKISEVEAAKKILGDVQSQLAIDRLALDDAQSQTRVYSAELVAAKNEISKEKAELQALKDDISGRVAALAVLKMQTENDAKDIAAKKLKIQEFINSL